MRLNEFASGGGDDRNDLQLYLNVALKLKMKKFKPETMRAIITKKMSELVNVVDADKVDWAYQMLRKEQRLSNMLDQHGVTEGEIVKGTFGQKFKPNLGRTVQTSPYEHRPDIDIPQYDPVRKTNWIKGISKENNKEPYDHFELDQTKPNIAHIIGVTKDGLQVKISTSNLKLAEILVDLYNRGGFTDADIEKIPMKSPEREKPKLKLVKSDDIEEDTTSPSEKVEAYGYVYNNRDQRIVWRKIFSSEDEANRWADRRNATVLGIKPLKPSDKISETSAGSVATVVNPKMKDRSKVGTLFGGTYKQRKDK